ncbi:60S ribosomal protein L31 [Asimina triloba]
MALSLAAPLRALQQKKAEPFSSNASLPKGGRKQAGRWFCKKKDIHPKFYENAKVYCNGEHVLTTGGTQAEYVVDVWSGNHPFYLGNRSAVVLEADQVEKFRMKYGQLANIMEIPNLKYGEIVIPPKKSAGKGKK